MRTHIAKRYRSHIAHIVTYSAPVTVGNVVRVCVCDGGKLRVALCAPAVLAVSRVALCAPAGLSSSMHMPCGWFKSWASGCAAECWSVSAGAAVARRERGEGYASTTLPPPPLAPPNIKSNRSVWQWSKRRRHESGAEAVIGGVRGGGSNRGSPVTEEAVRGGVGGSPVTAGVGGSPVTANSPYIIYPCMRKHTQNTHTHTHTCTCVCIYKYIFVYAYIYVYAYAYMIIICTCIQMYVCMYIYYLFGINITYLAEEWEWESGESRVTQRIHIAPAST